MSELRTERLLLRSWRESDGAPFAAINADPRVAEFVGFTGLQHVRFEAHLTSAGEIGWRLAHHAWGRGYATEAAQAMVRFAFADAGRPNWCP